MADSNHQALCDIDIQGDVDPVDEKTLGPVSEVLKTEESNPEAKQSSDQTMPFKNATQDQSQINRSGKSIHLATPAVRGLLKEHKLDITHIQGTGRDGRVMKEDVNAYLHSQASQDTSIIPPQQMVLPPSPTPTVTSPQAETLVSMTPIQAAMFKAMTRSLSIPHFLYSDEVDLTELSNLRTTINKSLSPHPKLSYLPFIIKAVSLALNTHPILNATILTSATSASPTPKLNYRPSHNIGIAIDTPQGLLVPVIKNVQHQTIHEIAQHLKHLHTLALSGQLPSNPHLLTGGTLTISNIGTIGGGVLSPMLVEGQSAILGVGRARDMPRFASDVAAAYGTKDVTATGGGDIMADAAKGAKGKGDGDAVRRRLISVFSWTADHRVLDGATMARFAEEVAAYLTVPGRMIVGMR